MRLSKEEKNDVVSGLLAMGNWEYQQRESPKMPRIVTSQGGKRVVITKRLFGVSVVISSARSEFRFGGRYPELRKLIAAEKNRVDQADEKRQRQLLDD